MYLFGRVYLAGSIKCGDSNLDKYKLWFSSLSENEQERERERVKNIVINNELKNFYH